MQPHESIPTRDSAGNGADAAIDQPPDSAEKETAVPTGYSPKTGRTMALLALAAAVVLAGAFWLAQNHRASSQAALDAQANAAADAPSSVDVMPVQYAPPTQTLLLPGQTSAWYQTTIYARVSGYLANWSADIGDRVKKGQILATIDTPDLDDQLAAARAKLNVSQADVSVMQADCALAKSNEERWGDSPKGVVSDQEREEKSAEYDSSIAKLNAARSQVKLDQADVDRLTEMASFKQVRAPFDGVITARRIDIGDLITAGSTANTTSLYTIAQSDRIRIFVDVPQGASVGINPGLPATATAEEYPGEPFRGQVARTSSAIDPQSRTLHAEVDIANPDLKLLPGMYVQVGFQLKQAPVLEVPASALLFRSGGPQVAVVADDGTVKFHDVTIAGDEGEVVQIGSGLSPNEKVALNISNQVAEGDRVKPIENQIEQTAQSVAPPRQPALASIGATH